MTAEHDLAAAGVDRIAWAARSMPVLAALARRVRDGGALKGLTVGVSLVLEPKTANLVLALREAGAEVVVHATPASTDDETAAALRAEGIPVYADAAARDEQTLDLARRLLSHDPDILVDDGAELIRLAHRERPDLVERMAGAAEETTSGIRPLTVMHDEGALRLPVIAVNDATTKYLFDNIYGTGQSCVMTFLDVTNLQLAGRVVVVVGYGWVGMGVARYASALGARVVVSEIDPVRALRALHDGYEVRSLSDAAPRAEVVFAATGIAGAVTPTQADALPDGAFLVTAGGGAFELPMEHLNGLGTARSVRDGVTAYTTEFGRTLHVLSEGECVNCADGEGNPIEVMDLSLSLQALAVEMIARDPERAPGLHPIPAEVEAEVAALRLEASGSTLEPVTDQLRAALRAW